MQKNSNKFGFSLLEISVVIIIIGILLSMVSGAKSYISKSRLTSAQGITSSAPVHLIDDLYVWYDMSLDSSLDEVVRDGSDLSAMIHDAASTVYHIKNNNNMIIGNDARPETGAAEGDSPVFVKEGINKIRTMQFTLAKKKYVFDGKAIEKSDFSIFVVERRSTLTNTGTFLNIGGIKLTYTANNSVFDIGGVASINANATSPAPAAIGNPVRIHYGEVTVSSGTKYRIYDSSNNDELVISVNAAQKTLLESYSDSNPVGLGASFGGMDIQISEVIVILGGVQDYERNDIVRYLGKKHGIIVP